MLERLRGLLADPGLQRAILVAVIVWVFWDGIWAGIPRSDQILYLHEVSRYDSLWDILSRGPSWNRTHSSPGDELLLYRPILYLLLGSFYYFFRYNFVAWQIAGLCLHVVVVLGLHLLLVQGRLQHTLFPLLIALLFGTAYFASELVFWNHIVGYVLFSALCVYAIYFFLRYLQSDRTVFLIPSAVLALLGEFTYESGALLNLLFAATLFARGLPAQVAGTTPPRGHRRRDLRLGLMFLLSAMLYPIASLIDLKLRGMNLTSPSHDAGSWQLILSAAQESLLQIRFWLSAWLIPTAYSVIAAGRAISAVSSSGLTALRLLNLFALVLLAVAGILALSRVRRTHISLREPLFAVALSMLFLFGYSMILAVGRTLPKGLPYVLHANIYYSYIAYLAVGVGIALAALAGRGLDPAASGDAEPVGAQPGLGPISVQTARPSRIGLLFAAALTILTIINASGVRELARAFRYDYAAPRQEVVDRVGAWRKQVGDPTQRYFAVSPTCSGNEVQQWFDLPQFRKDSGPSAPVTLVDLLWSDRSANLNFAKIQIPVGSVDEISCDDDDKVLVSPRR